MMTHRYYDAGKGRFINRDPIGAAGGINLYGFTGNNPVTGADPSGYADGILDRIREQVRARDQGELQLLKNITGIQAVENAFAATAKFGHGVAAQIQSDDPESERWNRQNVGNAYTWGRKVGDTIPVVVGAGLGGLATTRSPGNGAPDFVDPDDVRFSQSSIKGTFSNGGSVEDLAQGLKNGVVDPASIPPIRLMEKDGQMFTLDNRRLEAFRRAGVRVPFRMASPNEIAREGWKFTTQNGGVSIKVRGR